MIKQLLLVTIFTILLTAFTVQKLDSKEITQMVIALCEPNIFSDNDTTLTSY